MAQKQGLGVSVLEAARARLQWTLETFPRVYVSFSGGKDSSVLLHLAAAEARRQGRKIGCLFVDLEAQYTLTIEHVTEMFALYADCLEPYWVALPLHLRNAVSVFEPHWVCWEPGREMDWVRPAPAGAITDPARFPFFRAGMEFEEFVPAFGHWYGGGQPAACLVGIRADESLNRYRTINNTGWKSSFEGRPWTTWGGSGLYNVFPVYDWNVKDIWTFAGRFGGAYNRLYDRMHLAGLTLAQMRICQPYGDDQRKGLWLFHLIEPETWGRVVRRVSGANSGALYSQESGNVNGVRSISKPDGHTWESFAKMLLESQPPQTRQHFENKISVFLHWWIMRGYPNGIPDEADPAEEAAKRVPSWRRVCKTILRNDYWCKGLSFTQQKSTAYEAYQKVMKNRRRKWKVF